MNIMPYFMIVILYLSHHAMASDNPDNQLKINLSGFGYTKTPSQIYSSGKVNISGVGIIDMTDSIIEGPITINMGGTARVLLNHQNQLTINVGGIGSIYNFKKSSNLKTNIGGSCLVQENTWYPAWYLRNPWIDYVVPMLVVIGVHTFCVSKK